MPSGQDIGLLEPPAVAKKKPEPKPEPEQARTLFAIKGFPSWHDWLKRFAESRGMQATTLIDFCLREQAARDGFELPPKRF